jgi:spermidine/putrescine transport system substrate-binding protein
MHVTIRQILLFGFFALGLAGGCDSQPQKPPPSLGKAPTAPPAALARELIFYAWEGDMPQAVLDAFTKETGVKIQYESFTSQDELVANLRAGKVYDVATMENRLVPALAGEGLLAELNHGNIPNLKNISANYRELSYDPGNRYSLPYNWGTTGLVVRTDLTAQPVTAWADLWDPRYAGKAGLWYGQEREVIALTLKMLGYSANSEKPEELHAAQKRLLELKPNSIRLEDFDTVDSSSVMTSGKAVLSMGYAKDVLESRKTSSNINYVLPREGALLWGDNFVIPAKSSEKYTAEVFINFLLRPDINAMITNNNLYATPNEAALPLIDPAIRNDRVIFPTNEDLQNAEVMLPLSPTGEKLYAEIWEKFLGTKP